MGASLAAGAGRKHLIIVSGGSIRGEFHDEKVRIDHSAVHHLWIITPIVSVFEHNTNKNVVFRAVENGMLAQKFVKLPDGV